MEWYLFILLFIFPFLVYIAFISLISSSRMDAKSKNLVFKIIAFFVNFVSVMFIAISLFRKDSETNAAGAILGVLGLMAAFALGNIILTKKIAEEERNRVENEKEEARIKSLTPFELMLENRLKEKEENRKAAAMKEKSDELHYGPIVATLVCPHCQTKGNVRRKIGFTRKGPVLHKSDLNVQLLKCGNCETQWEI